MALIKVKPKKEYTPAEKLTASKQRLIKTLRDNIRTVRADAEVEVKRIESRIRIAQSLLDALQKGTLKP